MTYTKRAVALLLALMMVFTGAVQAFAATQMTMAVIALPRSAEPVIFFLRQPILPIGQTIPAVKTQPLLRTELQPFLEDFFSMAGEVTVIPTGTPVMLLIDRMLQNSLQLRCLFGKS